MDQSRRRLVGRRWPASLVRMKSENALDNLPKLADDLPKKKGLPSTRLRRKRNKEPVRHQVSFPECFAEVTRLTASKSPENERKRATLEAVASTLPDNAQSATGAQAAGIYLASLIVALRQVVASSSKPSEAIAKEAKKGSVKLNKKQKRLQLAREQRDVLEMSAMDARLATVTSKDVEMTSHDSIPEPCEQADVTENAHFIANIVYLIALAARSSSRSLVNAKARDILTPVTQALMIPSPSPLLARHAAAVISSVISVLNATTWESASSDISSAYVCLLSIAASSGPKNRRKAREELVILIRKVPLSYFRPLCSRMAIAWFKRTNDALTERCLKWKTASANDGRGKLVSQLLHHVAVFRYFVFTCNNVECAIIAKQILTLAQSPIPEVLPFLHNALAFLFCIPKNVANETGLLSPIHLEMVDETFSTGIPECKKWLRDQPPGIILGDAEKLLAAVAASTLETPCSIETRTSRARALLTMATAIFEYYPHTPPPPSGTVEIVQVLIRDIEPKNLSVVEVKQLSHFLHTFIKRKEVSGLLEVFKLLENLSTMGFKKHWNSLLPILQECLAAGLLFSQPQTSDVFRCFIRGLTNKRTDALAANDHAVVGMTERLLGSIVRGGGTLCLLRSIPVFPDYENLISNAWLLGLLKDNIRRAPLLLWKQKIFPLHCHCEESWKKLYGEEQFVESKNMKIYAHQLVGLLPGLCTYPSDLNHPPTLNLAFEAIHYCMTYSEPLVQSYGCAALRSYSESLQSLCRNLESGVSSGIQSAFSSRLKKLFPTVLTLSEKQNPEKRGVLLSALTIASQASADPGLLLNLLRKTVRRSLEATAGDANEMDITEIEGSSLSESSRIRHSAYDLSIAIVESGIIANDASEFSLLKRAVLPLLKGGADSTLQKKAYRVLSALINTGAFLTSKESLTEIIEELSSSSSHVAAGAVSSRLSTIQAVVQTLASQGINENHVESMKYCVSSFLPESILALRENSVKSRQSGLNLIKTMAEAWTKSTSTELGLDNFFIAIAAGLGGQSTAMVSGSLVAMGCFLQEFKNEVRENESLAAIVDSMFAGTPASSDIEMTEPGSESVAPGPIAILIRHEALEVQRSAVGVIKVAIGTLGSPLSRLLRLMPGFLPSLVAAAANSKRKEIRVRVKVVIERLLRKCGREVMEDLFPSEHKRLLSSVRKAHEREKQKRQEKKKNRVQFDGANEYTGVGDDDDYAGLGFESDDSDDEKAILDGNELITRKERQVVQNSKNVHERPGAGLYVPGNDKIEIDRNHERKLPNSASKSNSVPDVKDKEKVTVVDNAPIVFLESDEEDGAPAGKPDTESGDEIGAVGQTGNGSGRKRGREYASTRSDGFRKKGRSVPAAGSEYSSKKGAGDRKLSNRPDPYAYLPLSSSLKNISSSSVGKGAKAKRRSGKTKSRK